MKKMTLRMTIGLGVLALGAHYVSAQTTRACGPRPVILERLADKYGETRQSVGLGSNNAVIEVFASPNTGSWTITMTTANGVTCLMAAGNAFEQVQQAAAIGEPA